jgi:hypothetical protein
MTCASVTVTVGVDVAKASADTALCVVAWHSGRAVVEHVAVGVDDAAIVVSARDADVVALDAPFGRTRCTSARRATPDSARPPPPAPRHTPAPKPEAPEPHRFRGFFP